MNGSSSDIVVSELSKRSAQGDEAKQVFMKLDRQVDRLLLQKTCHSVSDAAFTEIERMARNQKLEQWHTEFEQKKSRAREIVNTYSYF